jgi:hypothetical protein
MESNPSASQIRLIMRSMFVVIVAMLVGYTANADPIDRLISDTNLASGLREQGYPLFDLTNTAASELVIQKIFETTIINNGRVASYKILDIRQIHIQGLGGSETAALVDTDHGQKIVIFCWVLEGNGLWKPTAGWWHVVYDASTLQPNNPIVKLNENDFAIVPSIAVAKQQYKDGQLDSAWVTLKAILRADPNNEEAYYFLNLVNQARYQKMLMGSQQITNGQPQPNERTSTNTAPEPKAIVN